MRAQHVLGHAQQTGFGFIGIGHQARAEHRRRSGPVRDPLGQQAPGAGFRRGQGQPAPDQLRQHHAFQAGDVHAVNHIPQTFAHSLHQGRGQRLGGRGVVGFGRNPHEHFPLGGVCGGRGIGPVRQILDTHGRRAFADAEGAHHEGSDGPVSVAPQKGRHARPQHGQQFRRRAGQQKHELPVPGGHGAARRGAYGIGKGHGPARQKSLLALIGAHGAAAEILFEPLQAVRVFLQRRAGHAGHGFLGQIVVRGPQAAGGDDQIAAGERLAQHDFQTPGIVAHHMNVQQIHAQG